MLDVEELIDRARNEIDACRDLSGLDDIRVRFLGKKGELTAQLKQLGSLSADERPAAGQAINRAKQQVQDIAMRALEGTSEAKALAHVNQIAIEQAKRPAGKA